MNEKLVEKRQPETPPVAKIMLCRVYGKWSDYGCAAEWKVEVHEGNLGSVSSPLCV